MIFSSQFRITKKNHLRIRDVGHLEIISRPQYHQPPSTTQISASNTIWDYGDDVRTKGQRDKCMVNYISTWWTFDTPPTSCKSLSLSIAVSMSPAGGWRRAKARNKKEQVSRLAWLLAASFRCSMPQAKLKFLQQSCNGETGQTSWEVHSIGRKHGLHN